MLKINNNFDTSNELIISRYGHGIKLKKPAPQNKSRIIGASSPSSQTVSTLLQLPFNVYFFDTRSKWRNANEICALTCYGGSIQSALGKGALDIAPRESAEKTIQNDKIVINTGKLIIIEEEVILKDATRLSSLSIKLPWYNHENKIIGLLGLSVLLGQHPLAESLQNIAQLGLLTPPIKNQLLSERYEINNVCLSKRETDVMRLLIRGNTAKQVAKKLFLSPRTIEDHIENIKTKTNTASKAELIDKAMEQLLTTGFS